METWETGAMVGCIKSYTVENTLNLGNGTTIIITRSRRKKNTHVEVTILEAPGLVVGWADDYGLRRCVRDIVVEAVMSIDDDDAIRNKVLKKITKVDWEKCLF